MKKILVPCDFSDAAREAYTFACQIASVSDGEVMALYVLEFPFNREQPYHMASYADDLQGLFEALQKSAHKSFEKMKNSHPEEVKVSFHVRQGTVVNTVVDFIREHHIDLVIMGTVGHSKWQGWFVGNHTEKVVRFSPVPVISLKKAPTVAEIRHVVLPTDTTSISEEWIVRAKALQAFFNATLHVLIVNTPVKFITDNKARKQLQAFADKYQLEKVTLNVRNDLHVPEGIIHFSLEINAQMIAMPTHGRKGLEYLFSGSVAGQVVNDMVVPVWTYSLKKETVDF